MGTPRGWGDTVGWAGGVQQPFSALVAMQGSLLFAAGEEGNVGSGDGQKALTLPCAVFPVLEWAYPRTAWTLSGVSTDPSTPGTSRAPPWQGAGASQAW